jgi:endonuclease YncB( thermonuclease family)
VRRPPRADEDQAREYSLFGCSRYAPIKMASDHGAGLSMEGLIALAIGAAVSCIVFLILTALNRQSSPDHADRVPPTSHPSTRLRGHAPFRRPEKKPPALWPVWLIVAAIAPVMAYFYMMRWGPQVAHAPDPSRPAVTTGEIVVVDGDTVRHQGHLYRLVGFDTPEKGDLARCEGERRLAEKATERLRQLILSGNADLRRVSCECRPGEEGTPRCNYGRLCGSLTAGGRDVGRIRINEGLAHPYVCSTGRCPPKRSWC